MLTEGRRFLQMKNDLIWTKTLLSVYRYLERICGAIDKIVMKSALNSADILGQNYFYNNVYSISQKIIDLSERKITLINLKILIEETLGEIDKKSARILIQKYFDGTKCKDIALINNVSLRTVFRKISNAENAFSCRLRMKGYNSFKLDNILKEEGWINNVFLRLSEKNDEDFSLSNSYLAKAVSM